MGRRENLSDVEPQPMRVYDPVMFDLGGCKDRYGSAYWAEYDALKAQAQLTGADPRMVIRLDSRYHVHALDASATPPEFDGPVAADRLEAWEAFLDAWARRPVA